MEKTELKPEEEKNYCREVLHVCGIDGRCWLLEQGAFHCDGKRPEKTTAQKAARYLSEFIPNTVIVCEKCRKDLQDCNCHRDVI